VSEEKLEEKKRQQIGHGVKDKTTTNISELIILCLSPNRFLVTTNPFISLFPIL
jgi:hypothetical protein